MAERELLAVSTKREWNERVFDFHDSNVYLSRIFDTGVICEFFLFRAEVCTTT